MVWKKGEIPKGAKPFVKDDPRINKEGRPPALPDLNDILIECLGKNEMTEIIKVLRDNARKGGVREMELLLERAYGRVKQDVEVKGNIVLNFDLDDKGA
jgi:hypothetical protein